MSLSRVDQPLGALRTPEQTWRVLNRPLPDYICHRYDALRTELRQPASSVPWRHHQCQWELRDGKLYLSELFRPDLLEMLINRKELLATWVEKLILHRVTEIPLGGKECLDTNSYRLHVTQYDFSQGTFTAEHSYIATRNLIKGAFQCEEW
jgi:hypothetical protein